MSLADGAAIDEGGAGFAQYQAAVENEVERLLLLAASHYRRSFDLMLPSASAWAHVTMYYGSFFAGSALMGMFGTWKMRRTLVLEAVRGGAGSQRFEVGKRPSTYKGSHEQFWDLFYANSSSLVAWVDPKLAYAIAPVGGDPTWLSRARNDLNYDSFSACALSGAFLGGFQSSQFPGSLPGVLNTQYRILEGLLQVASGFARQFRLESDALAQISGLRSRQERLRALVVTAKAPRLDRKLRKRALVG